ncbi:MAG: 30S ribosomal protein S8e [Nanoarchaeota archaeon]
MAIPQARSKRKVSGSRYRSYRKKRLFELGNLPRLTKLGENKIKTVNAKFGKKKKVLLDANIANIYNPKTKKYSKSKIITIVENKANRHFVRRNIMTKGAIIKTEIGNARITSRPGQEPVVNAILIE